MKNTSLGFTMAALLILGGLPATAMAQVIGQPEPGPRPTPIITYFPAQPAPVATQFPPQPGTYGPYFFPPPTTSYYGAPPPPIRPSAYSFNGPSPATVTYATSTITHYQPAPGGGNRLTTSTIYTPVYGYQQNYYLNYYTPLYYRQ